jgi:hypothetical protein
VGKTIRSPALPDRVERTSFSSIKENITGVPQSFTDSKTSSYLRRDVALLGSEDAVDSGDCLSSGCSTPVEKDQSPEMLCPQSALHGLVCPCDSFRGWKSISIGGKVASKSFGDLRRLARGWDWEAKDDRPEKMIVGVDGIKEVRKEDGKIMPGQSPLERLPMELLGEFFLRSLNVLLKDGLSGSSRIQPEPPLLFTRIYVGHMTWASQSDLSL